VFVHGLHQTGGLSFGEVRRRLEAKGCECFAPTLTPSDARDGLDRLAGQLKEHLDARYGPDERLSIVGFSMGGLIARHYLQELGGAPRCDRLVTVSTPHHGTWSSWFHPGKGARQMRPGSAFLRRLQETEDRLGGMRLISYRSPFDPVILPSDSPMWARAENREFPGYIHTRVTRSGPLVEELVREMTR
jgi:triacylglycerol lipase